MKPSRRSGSQAFRLLTQASQETNGKLFEVADELVRSGELAGRGGYE